MDNSSPQQSICPDILRWSIFLALLNSSAVFAAGGLQPTLGPGGTAIVNNDHKVPVIDIVAPNAAGLSHNHFLDYNVGKPGVVLNNALHAGNSQLAGALAANAQFQGQAASSILNEVVSTNASLIEGPQEIFGHPADYILANPNGITLNGGSFINTTRSTFLVGTPQMQGQQLEFLDSLATSGSLQVLDQGQSNAAGALRLIAPRIDSKGPLSARDELSLTVGHNRIQANSGEIVAHLPASPSSIDAQLFGAMRAGQIRVVSTAEGAGVRMGPVQMQAQNGISIRSAGELQIDGHGEQPARLHSDRGALSLSAADDLTLRAVHGKAEHIALNAGKKLTLDTQTQHKIDKERQNWENKTWFVTTETYDRKRSTDRLVQQGTELSASGNIDLNSADDMHLLAADLKAGGELNLTSGKNLSIEAGIESQKTEESIRHRKLLWRGDSDRQHYQETAKDSSLSGKQVAINAADTLKLRGSKVQGAEQIQLAAKQVELTTQALQENATYDGYHGDLVSGALFADRDGAQGSSQTIVGSTVDSGGKLSVTAEQVLIKGSQVSSAKDSVLYSGGGLTVEADQGQTSSTQRQSDSKLFGLIANAREQSSKRQQVVTADVSSKSDLRLASAAELNIHGAKLEAAKHLHLDAKGDLLIESAQEHSSQASTSQQRGFSASASQTQESQDGAPDSGQYQAGVGYEVVDTASEQRKVNQIASELKGGSVTLSSDKHLQVTGSNVQAATGALSLAAKQLTLGATHNEDNVQTTTRTSGGGLIVTGGIDSVGSMYEGHSNQDVLSETHRQAQRSELKAAGDVKITTEQLLSEAAQLEAGKQLSIDAKHIDNRSVQDSKTREHSTDKWRGTLGASVEYRDLTRPIERLVQGEEAARFQQASTEDAMAAPSVGADLAFEHTHRVASQQGEIAQVNQFSGSSLVVKAGTIDDQGSSWRANSGTVHIEADKHHLRAAQDKQVASVDRLDYGGDLRVDTSTGEDVNLRVSGKGGSQQTRDHTISARPGSLYGQQGIQVQLGSDGRYEGTRFNGGEGDVKLSSVGQLTLAQSNDTTSHEQRKLTGDAWLKAGNTPTSTGLDARGYLHQEQSKREDSKAQVAQIDAKGKVMLASGGDLLLEGTRIGSREAKVGDLQVQSGGLLQVKAASDTHQANGAKLGGGLEVAAKKGSTVGGGLGANFTYGKLEQTANTAVDAHFASAGSLRLSSSAREQIAVHLQGLNASAFGIELQARNGGMLIEASSNHERRDDLDITAGAGFAKAKGTTEGAIDTQGIHGRIKVDLDKRDSQTWNASTLRADKIDLHSQEDSSIEGTRLDAGLIEGEIGGDLRMASRKDQVDSLTLNVDARLSKENNPQGYNNALGALAGPAGAKAKEKFGEGLSKVDPKLSPTVKIEVSQQQRDTVAHQAILRGSQGVELKVGGDATLSGAKLQSLNGAVELQAASIHRQTLSGRDYRRDGSVDLSNAPVDVGTAIVDASKGKGSAQGENPIDLGLLRTSGHDRKEHWVSSVQGKTEH